MGNLPKKIVSSSKFSLLIAFALVVLTLTFSIHAAASFASWSSTHLSEISGKIRDTQGRPVAALNISLMNWFGAELGSAVTDDKGMFEIRNVVPGSYYVKFRPLAESIFGQVVIMQIPTHHMKMNLTVTRNPPAIARTDTPVMNFC